MSVHLKRIVVPYLRDNGFEGSFPCVMHGAIAEEFLSCGLLIAILNNDKTFEFDAF